MKLNKFLESADGQIIGGSEYQWKCYGPDARFMDVSDIDNHEVVNAVFDSKTKKVYEVTAHVYEDDVAYRWVDPKYASALFDEAIERGLDSSDAYDDVHYTEVDDADEILELVHKLVHKTYVHSHADCLNSAGQCAAPESCQCEDATEERHNDAKDKTEYTVKITRTDEFDVRATSMEDAVEKAKNFVRSFAPTNNGLEQVSWLDNYFTKEEVIRNLVTETYED